MMFKHWTLLLAKDALWHFGFMHYAHIDLTSILFIFFFFFFVCVCVCGGGGGGGGDETKLYKKHPR